MTGQKEIAEALGVTQSAVSKALRGHPAISDDLRQKVQETAEKLGYRLNEHVSALMSNIRTGKKLHDQGTIGLLVDAPSQQEWHKVGTFRRFHQGVLQRGQDLGFHIESFFLRDPGMRAARIDQILTARGIKGIILAVPGRGKSLPDLQWENYAVVDASVSWEEKKFTRVCCDQFYNYTTVFNELLKLGYKRIGTVLISPFVKGSRWNTKWHAAYLECRNDIPAKDRIPVCMLQTGITQKDEDARKAHFQKWITRWQPDTIITLNGAEKEWLDALQLNVPQDIGLACLSEPMEINYAHIDESLETLGATAVELVSAQIARNESGPLIHRKTTLIEGCWTPGSTVRKQN